MGTTTRGQPRRTTRDTRAASDEPEYALIPLDQIEPDPALSRDVIDRDQLRDLARSLERHGQLTPIAVRRVAGRDKLLIISGERRWRAAALTTGIRTLSCLIYEDQSEADALLRRLAEDLAREGFPLLELGEMIARVQTLRGWSLRRLAAELGVPVGRVHRPLVLHSLPHEVREMVRRGELRPSHAFEIDKAPPGRQRAIAETVVKEGLSFDETVELVSLYRATDGHAPQVKRRRWKFPFPGDCEVVVITPPEVNRGVIRRMLYTVLTLLEEVETASSAAVRS